ncbi:hypothetical protein K469DRAFT_648241, partial [Zopfia rhizophila CBS 207.26]
MTWRYEEIPLAYQKTFQWVFEEPTRPHGWNDFAAHLSRPDLTSPYFINGKAGSGKSTLMKFIVGHPKTKEALAQWASNGELMIVKFFFGNLGTDLQKTSIGMLRALMHDILERYPELIPGVFSGMYQSWRDTAPASENQPNYIEMKSAFERLIRNSAKFLKLCVFIDGIDEFDGDHKDISEFIRSLASQHVKIVVSSRPITACLNAFHGCPTLKLQDLTEYDMELYVKDNLAAHRSMVELTKRFPQETSELVAELKEKAAGVFLWVRLVVRLLVDGIEAGDDVRDLQRKLRSLPPDLRALYRRMISKMEPDYQVQAAEIFQLLHAWNLYIPDQPFRTIVLSFAVQSPSKAFSQQALPLHSETYQWLCKKTKARVSSRCCGLLDSGSPQVNYTEMNGSVVDYLHRTVAEFLASDDVWGEICGMTKASGFDAALSLASACLSMIK